MDLLVYEDIVVTEPIRAAVHYIRTWLAFDLTIVGIDWILFYLTQAQLLTFVIHATPHLPFSSSFLLDKDFVFSL